jgi:rhodanese-related sulfurtransferase
MDRTVKDRLYTAWADIAKALGSARRVELLDVLAQGERTVEALAKETGLTVNNTSSHLKVLKTVRLVETRREAQFVFYRLADDTVLHVMREIQALTRRRLHEVDQLARAHIDDRDSLEPVSAAELRRRLKAGDVTVIDVRPDVEFGAGHIAGAISIPLGGLERRLARVPRGRPVIAYCRGPYCVLAVEAVARLRKRGYQARRLAGGFPDWKVEGLPIQIGTGQ